MLYSFTDSDVFLKVLYFNFQDWEKQATIEVCGEGFWKEL